ncbi:branched-chain amino acid ABC transporter permease [Xinfangfangia sp. D13-10-4-6]|uniref:branched-chain amino acid ABC transporter permease n=1 Tax=Pseudogemmobacter hezensis TaxID=2737662 RepID=UPI0015547884|nr:branched-chain amino acid ABC transporter permease [Pseudogemmobacter hezensis]NPD16339.1 branched-chain amino acid ABC transporter permease [Pseudogemmobacter hezensis]
MSDTVKLQDAANGRAPAPSRQILALGVIAVLAALLPLVASDYQLRFVAEILIVGAAVLSLDLLVGYGGLVSLGHATLFGGAAYAAAVASRSLGADLTLMVGIGTLTGMVMAFITGIVVMRTIALFFLILTLIVGQIFWEIAFHWRDVTGGADGMRGLPTLSLNLGVTKLDLSSSFALYVTAAVLAFAAWAVARSFVNAPIGRALIGTRERQLRMSALGYDIARIRMMALLASGAIAGAAGSLYPFVNQYIGPNSMQWTFSAMMVVMLVIGGVGSLYGAFIGTAVYLGIQTYISSYTDRWQLVVGLIFVLTVMIMPRGIVHGVGSLFGGKGKQ